MAKILTEAYQAKDGTIFESYDQYIEYETSKFARTAPMLKFDDNFNLNITNDATNVNFIMLKNEINKNLFIEFRNEALEMNLLNSANNKTDLEHSFEYTTIGLNATDSSGEAIYGIFAIFSKDNINWSWLPFGDYINIYNTIIEKTNEVSSILVRKYLSNTTI